MIAIYDIATRKIDRFVICTYDHIAMQCQVGEDFYLNCSGDATHIINNEPVTIIPELVPSTEAELLVKIRQKRNILLSACDWTQIADAPLTTEQSYVWAVYRQDLRDFPAVCNPLNPVWPVKP